MPVRTVIAVWPLFMGLSLIGLAVGVQGSLLGVRAELEGFEVTRLGHRHKADTGYKFRVAETK